MKGMGSKMKGLKMGFGKKKDKEDEPDKDKPDKTTGGIGSSAWRRRLEESAMQKLGLSKAEKDENTGDVDEELARFRATAADVAELLKRAEAYGNLTRSADEALLDHPALEMLFAYSDFEAFKSLMLATREGANIEASGGLLCVSGDKLGTMDVAFPDAEADGDDDETTGEFADGLNDALCISAVKSK